MGKLFLILFFFTINCCSAQDPVKRIINDITGLPSNTVYDVYQDKKGFIWIGHDKGLCRYDGNSFVVMKGAMQQGKAVSNIMEHGESIWCQDFAGNYYFTRHDSLIAEPLLKSKTPYWAAGIISDKLLVSVSGDSLRSYDLDTRKMVSYILARNPGRYGTIGKDCYITSFYDTLFSFNGHRVDSIAIIKTGTSFFIVLNNTLFGISKNTTPYLYNLSTNTILKNSLPAGLFIQRVAVIKDEIWMATTTGAFCLNLDFSPKFGSMPFFMGTNISKVMKDREGNYWFATLNRGIYFVPNLDFKLYRYKESGITSLFKRTIGGNLFAGTENNEILEFGTNKKFTSIYKAGTNHEVISIFTDKNTDHFYFCSDNIYLAKHNNQLLGKFMDAGKAVARINNDFFAAATSNGLCLIPATGKKNIPAWLSRGEKGWSPAGLYYVLDKITRARWVIFSEGDSTLYAATINGLIYFSPAGRGEVLLNGKSIYAAHLAISENYLFAATLNDGLLQILKNKVTKQWTDKNGLRSNAVYKVQALSDELWIIADDAIQKIDRSNNQVFTYNYTDGLPKAEIKDIAVDSNKVYVATPEGLVLFDRQSVTKNNVTPLLQVTKFTVNGKPLNSLAAIRLSAGENNIGLYFSVLSFKGGNDVIVKYKINAGEWLLLPPGARSISLPLLSAGHYTLQVQAFNEDGIGEEKPLQFSFTILKPWYERTWVMLLAGFLFLLIVFTIYKIRVAGINHRNKLEADKLRLEQEVQQSILSSIKSQMNPHFIFNALNTIQSYIYLNDKENASLYLGKFSQLTRKILDMSSRDFITLAEELEMLSLYLELEKQRFEESLNYEIIVGQELSTETILMPSMLVQPYVENAIKHGLLNKKDDKTVAISFNTKEDVLNVIIDDNGIGRKKTEELQLRKQKQHDSFATGANQQRLDILNRYLKNAIAVNIEDKYNQLGEATGTKVTLSIPLQQRKV